MKNVIKCVSLTLIICITVALIDTYVFILNTPSIALVIMGFVLMVAVICIAYICFTWWKEYFKEK